MVKGLLKYWQGFLNVLVGKEMRIMNRRRSRDREGKSLLWVLVVIVLAFTLLKIDTSGAQIGGGERYRKAISKEISYGKEKGKLGLFLIKGLPRRGPESFTNDIEGNLYICDTVNQKIQIYSQGGDFLYEIPLKEGMTASDIATDESGNIYIYDDLQGRLYQYDKKGNLLVAIPVDFKKWQSRGPMHIVNNEVYIRTSNQEDILIGKIINGSLVPPVAEDLLQPIKKGIHGFSGRRYFVRLVRFEKGEIEIIDKGGVSVKRITLPLKGIVSISFLQEDKWGNFYVQTERVENEQLLLEVHKFDPNGSLITTVLIPENDYISWSVKLLSIDRDGNIYQFLPTRDKGRLNIFRKEQ
jgi:hypothetical protein